MSKKSNKKEIVLGNTKVKGMDGKTYYIKNTANSYFLDCNNVGNVYFNKDPCKWEFIKTETIGTYFIKHVNTGLYRTSDEHGEIFTTVLLNSTLQKWNIFSTPSVPETYNYQNMSNELYILVSKTEDVFLYDIHHNKDAGFFHTFQRFPKK